MKYSFLRNILYKELKLSASILSYLFIVFGLMFFLPGYPVLCGAFFISFGIFQSFQNAREANDVLYTVLLPVAKRDAVIGKYVFACFIELCGFCLMAAVTLIRMTVLSNAMPYRSNALMNANPFALGCALLIFALFNVIFIGGFFRTACRFTRPLIFFIIAAMAFIGTAETLHRIPGLEALNAFGFENAALQGLSLAAGAVIYVLLTILACRKAVQNFEKIDL